MIPRCLHASNALNTTPSCNAFCHDNPNSFSNNAAGTNNHYKDYKDDDDDDNNDNDDNEDNNE